jgi:hypothetical protein
MSSVVCRKLCEHLSLSKAMGLWAGWTGFDSWQRQEIFIFCTASRLALRADPASCPMGTGDTLMPGGKAAGVWSQLLTSIYCQGWEWWSCTPPFCHMSSWLGGELMKRMDSFTVLILIVCIMLCVSNKIQIIQEYNIYRTTLCILVKILTEYT